MQAVNNGLPLILFKQSHDAFGLRRESFFSLRPSQSIDNSYCTSIRCKRSPPPPSDLHIHPIKRNRSFLFKNILSLMFNDSCKAAHSVVEDALNVLKNEVIPHHRNRLFNFLMRAKFAIFHNSFQQAKELKVT
jgi:hypothetical protein